MYGMQRRSGISGGCTQYTQRPHRGESGARGAEHNQSECPLTARGGPHRGFDETIPRYAPPRVWAGDPCVRCVPRSHFLHPSLS